MLENFSFGSHASDSAVMQKSAEKPDTDGFPVIPDIQGKLFMQGRNHTEKAT